MRFQLTLLLALGCVVGACQTESQQQDQLEQVDPDALDSIAAEIAPAETSVPFQPVAGADPGPGGEAILMPAGERTRVTVELTGAPAGTYQGHVHEGTCESPGEVVAPLNPVATNAQGEGSASTTVELPTNTLMDGDHILLYHQAGGNPGPPVTCAQLPRARGLSI